MCTQRTPGAVITRQFLVAGADAASPAQPSPVTFSPVTVLPAPAPLSPPPPRPNHRVHQIQFNDFIKFRIYSQIHHPLHNLHNIYTISPKSYISKNVGWVGSNIESTCTMFYFVEYICLTNPVLIFIQSYQN